jgi:dTDP-4-amino-4,6-dideoxygalactose transaminase
MKIPFGTLSLTDESRSLINNILRTRKLSQGKYVQEFEKNFAELIGTREAVAVSSGTDAVTLALAVMYDLGARRGDEVIVPALSFVATGNAVLHAGFTPVFIDVGLETLNIDPDKIEKAITKRTKAILPVHLMGKPAAMDRICSIAGKHKLLVIEDAAEAHGSVYKNKNIGTIGSMAAFSLYVAHMISTVEGGIVTTDNPDFAEILRSLRAHGRSCNCKVCTLNTTNILNCRKRFKSGKDIRFMFERVGYSSKMNELEAAVGLGNIKMWPEYLRRRRENLLYLLEHFKKFEPELFTISEWPGEKIGPHAFPVILGRNAKFVRDQLVDHLNKHGIDSRHLFLSMPTQCRGFKFLGYKTGDFPNAEYMGKNGLHIGIHQDLTIKHMKYFIKVIEKFLLKA